MFLKGVFFIHYGFIYELHQMGVKTTFFNIELLEEFIRLNLKEY